MSITTEQTPSAEDDHDMQFKKESLVFPRAVATLQIAPLTFIYQILNSFVSDIRNI